MSTMFSLGTDSKISPLPPLTILICRTITKISILAEMTLPSFVVVHRFSDSNFSADFL